jgi:hypothetical protein
MAFRDQTRPMWRFAVGESRSLGAKEPSAMGMRLGIRECVTVGVSKASA